MHGIDISNWQAGLKLSALKNDIDFVICKVSEGLGFKDNYAAGWLKDARALGLLTGIYHYARKNDPTKEAAYFLQCAGDEVGRSLLVLDYEEGQGGQWAKQFVAEIYRLTKIYPLVYCSASVCKDFAGTDIPSKCGLWVAGYPVPERTNWPSNTSIPYSIAPWKFAAMWQFTSALRLGGYSGRLDGNIAYMNEAAWKKYASGSKKPPAAQSLVETAAAVICGKYGNGADRIDALKKAGYDPAKVQDLVNLIYKLEG